MPAPASGAARRGGLVEESEQGDRPVSGGAAPWYLQQAGTGGPAPSGAPHPPPAGWSSPPVIPPPRAVEAEPAPVEPSWAVPPPPPVPPPRETPSAEQPAPGPPTPAHAPPATVPSTSMTFQQVVDAQRAAAGQPPRRTGVPQPVLLGALAVVLVTAGAVTGITLARQSDGDAAGATGSTAQVPSSEQQAPQPVAPTATASASTASASTASASTVAASPEGRALSELSSLRRQSLAGLVLDGRWVAQVASKSVGITDPLQVAQNGTHTFYAVDILAESTDARAMAGSSTVLVLQSTDFGKYSTAADGQPYWVTLVDGGFGSDDAVESWCAVTYAGLSEAELANTCVPRTLSPSHP